MNKTILFDADGVLTLPEEMFSVVYARSYGFDPEPFELFFRTEWKDIVTGKRDLKESIDSQPELWRWKGSTDELLQYWFETEDVRNEELLQIIHELRQQGAKCYLATEQEAYRGGYMKNTMFSNLFDGYFITADLGVSKSEPRFFEMVLAELGKEEPDLLASNVVFFDDSQSKVDVARSIGVDARLYTEAGQVRSLLKY